MLKLTPSEVNAARTLVAWALRAAAVILLALGSYLFLKKLLFGVGTGMLNMTFRIYQGVGEEHSTYRGLAMLLVGAALAILSRRIARWVIALPEQGCPCCGYTGAVNDTCPECGQKDVTPRT